MEPFCISEVLSSDWWQTDSSISRDYHYKPYSFIIDEGQTDRPATPGDLQYLPSASKCVRTDYCINLITPSYQILAVVWTGPVFKKRIFTAGLVSHYSPYFSFVLNPFSLSPSHFYCHLNKTWKMTRTCKYVEFQKLLIMITSQPPASNKQKNIFGLKLNYIYH